VAGKIIEPRVNIPPLIEQGDTVSWPDEPFTDDQGAVYNATLYTLNYSIVGASAPLIVTAATEGVGWLTTLTPTQTATLAPGASWWQAQLKSSDNSIVVTVARGQILVSINLANAPTGYSGLSVAAQNLAAAKVALAALTGNGGAPVDTYRIGDREMKYLKPADALAAIAYWQGVVINEQTANSIAQNQGNPRKLYARFPGRFGSGS
jgi:hypothetical protein